MVDRQEEEGRSVRRAACPFKWPVDDIKGGGDHLFPLFTGRNEWTPKKDAHWSKPKLLRTRAPPKKKQTHTVTSETSRLGGTSLLRIEGDVFFFFGANLRGEALMISLNLHVNGDISLHACQGPAGLPDVKAKSISRPLPSCPSMHFIGTTPPLGSPALFFNGLIGKMKKQKKTKGRRRRNRTKQPPRWFALGVMAEIDLKWCVFFLLSIKY